jgi:hypothetical protein
MGRRPNPDPTAPTLVDVPVPAREPAPVRPGPGPIYQGVCKQIRAIFGTGKERQNDDELRRRFARSQGTIAAARSLAASLDRVSGDRGYQASGHQLSMMHAQLDQLLARLTDDGAGSAPAADPLADFERSLSSGRATSPH